MRETIIVLTDNNEQPANETCPVTPEVIPSCTLEKVQKKKNCEVMVNAPMREKTRYK